MALPRLIFLLAPTLVLISSARSSSLNSPHLLTNYEYYTIPSIESGLSSDKPSFYLNGKEIFIYSGAIHYFRVPRLYWRDRLRKLRAAGLNTVETFIPWNLHEPKSGEYDFGNNGNDMSDFLHLQEFLQTAKEEDLFVIVRPGPFIYADFEFGGLPSWLLRNDGIEVRTSNAIYMNYVTRWFKVLMPLLAQYQFTKGGSIIMFQVENRYSMSGKHDLDYLLQLRTEMIDNGIQELLVTADRTGSGTSGTLPDTFLMTAIFYLASTFELDKLKEIQPGRPTMAMEYWTGWFGYWGGFHNVRSLEEFVEYYEPILQYPASVNIYMFQGGTNFGFLNGAENIALDDANTDYRSIVSSYDYNAPLDETGNYTDKYWATKQLLEKYNPIKTKLPDVPTVAAPVAYPAVTMTQEIFLYDILDTITPTYSPNVIPMEMLDVNDGNGQSYGYVVYRKTGLNLPANSVLEIEGRVCDTFMVLVNGVLVTPWLQKSDDLNGVGTSMVKDTKITLTDQELTGARLEIVVENWGRVSVGSYKTFKGLWQGGVMLNNQYLYNWAIYPLEFKSAWTRGLYKWQQTLADSTGPVLYKGTLTISGDPEDTFVHMEGWIKGIVIVNGFVLGRYAKMGPVQTLFLPAPLLVQGDNTIIIFEHFKAATSVSFTQNHVYRTTIW